VDRHKGVGGGGGDDGCAADRQQVESGERLLPSAGGDRTAMLAAFRRDLGFAG
jgi:hypothetical protein